MDTSKLSRNDWIVVAGMALMFLAMLLARLDVAAVVAWFLSLLAASLVVVKVVPGAKLVLPFSIGVLVMALGGAALLVVLLSPGLGAFVGFIAALVIAFGGFLKNAETP
jgi:hypothetical protein